MKSQATTMATMQGQLTNIQQFCMAVGQQPPPNIYTPAQQQHTFNNCRNRCNGGGHGNGVTGGSNGGGGGSFPQQPTWFGGNGAGAQQPTWENWNYCLTHGGDVDDTHTSTLCRNRGPTHNPNARINRRNAQDHPSLSVQPYSPPPRRPQQQLRPQQHPPVSHYPVQGMKQSTYRAAARPRHDEFCRTAITSTKCRERADDAAASSAGDAHDGTLLCSQPTTLLCPQPAAAGILLASRGGQ